MGIKEDFVHNHKQCWSIFVFSDFDIIFRGRVHISINKDRLKVRQ